MYMLVGPVNSSSLSMTLLLSAAVPTMILNVEPAG